MHLIIGSENKIINKAVVTWAASCQMTDIIRPSCCCTVIFLCYVVMQHTAICNNQFSIINNKTLLSEQHERTWTTHCPLLNG